MQDPGIYLDHTRVEPYTQATRQELYLQDIRGEATPGQGHWSENSSPLENNELICYFHGVAAHKTLSEGARLQRN